MADGALRKVDEGPRNREARALRLDALDRKQVAGAAIDQPNDRSWRNARLGEIAGRVAPPVEVILRRQGNAVGVDHRAFAQHVSAKCNERPAAGFPNGLKALSA